MTSVRKQRTKDDPRVEQYDVDDAASSFERIPPQDLDAEKCVLGGMLLSKDAIGDVIPLLKAEDYYRPAHATIHDAILELYAQGEPADPITVAAELTKSGDIARVGGASYLHTLVQHVPTSANAEYYAEIVHEAAVLRRLAEAGTRIHEMAHARRGEVREICDAAQAEIYGVTEATNGQQEAGDYIGDIMEGVLDEIQQNEKGGADEITGLPTGLKDLDSLTQGLQPGQMIVIAARPAMGKSTFALDIARSCAIENGKTAVFFSLEMGKNELTMRTLSAEARVALHHMRSGTMTDEDWTRLARRTPDVSAAPLYIDDSPNQTMMYIRSQARRHAATGNLGLVVIDYLQLLSGGIKAENRQQEVSYISRNIKTLAKELGVPIIALSQLNRGPEHRTDKKPMVSDLRESGSIEQDADIVILMYREDMYEKESPRAGEVDLMVEKHRNGPTARITAAFQGHYSRIVDMAQT